MGDEKVVDTEKRVVAYNASYTLNAVVFVAAAAGFLYLLVAEHAVAWVLLGLSALGLFLLLLDAAYYMFDERGVTAVFLGGRRQHVAWADITRVEKFDFHSVHKDLPHFSLWYTATRRDKTVKKGIDIPVTAKVTKAIETWYIGDVHYQTRKNNRGG